MTSLGTAFNINNHLVYNSDPICNLSNLLDLNFNYIIMSRYFKSDDNDNDNNDNAVPLGVPVDIISPGSSVKTLLNLEILFH